MATARQGDESPYGAEVGFGKFRKRPTRRTQKTPYARPVTASRNPVGEGRSATSSWLAKLVDPAQRFIATGAQMFFSSLFRKRLLLQRIPEPVENYQTADKQEETVHPVSSGMQDAMVNVGVGAHLCRGSHAHGFSELENILKQNTFTRTEIDRLTALLQSRTVDSPMQDDQKKLEILPSEAVSFQNAVAIPISSEATSLKAMESQKRETLPLTPVKVSGIKTHPSSTPIFSSMVLDEDVASPAELARAYMGRRSSHLSPSPLTFRNQPMREDSPTVISHRLPSKSQIAPSKNSPSCNGFPDNGFVTPRSLGRTAIYNMARSPYTRLHGPTFHQGVESPRDPMSVPSFSCKKGSLKRRSLVLDNDIGSISPLRRIRQKSNLLSTSRTHSTLRSFPGSDVSHHPSSSSSSQAPVFVGESSVKSGNGVCGSKFAPVSSRSSEMASKILEQLNSLVSTRERSPTKLSPSMLHGQALRSLEHVDSLKLLEKTESPLPLRNTHDRTAVVLHGSSSVSPLEDKVEENLPATQFSSSMEAHVRSMEDKEAQAKMVSSSVHPSPHNTRPFKMSACEDYLEVEDKECHVSLEEQKVIVAEAAAPELQSMPVVSSMTESPIGFKVSEQSLDFTFPIPPSSPTVTFQHSKESNKLWLASDETGKEKDSHGVSSVSVFPQEDKPVFQKDSNGACALPIVPPPLSVSSSSSPSVFSGLKVDSSFSRKSKRSHSSACIDNAAPELPAKEPELVKTDNQINIKDVIFSTSSAMASFGVYSSSSSSSALCNTSSLSNGLISSASVKLPAMAVELPAPKATAIVIPPTSANAPTSSMIDTIPSSSSSHSSFSCPPISSSSGFAAAPPCSTLETGKTTMGEQIDPPKEGDNSIASSTSAAFGGTSCLIKNDGSNNVFNGKGKRFETESADFGSTTAPATKSSNPFLVNPVTSSSFIFSSSSFSCSSSSSGLIGSFSTSISSSSSLLNSSSVSKPFSSAFYFGAPSSSSSHNNTTTTTCASSAIAAPSPMTTSSFFSFTSATAPNFSFASSSPSPNEEMNMEDSMAEDTVQPSTLPVFAQQPAGLPSSSSSFVFGSATPPSVSNPFSPTLPPLLGGAQPALPPPSGAIPFQFGSQPNFPTSPFQASPPGLGFGAGGSFSLGSGGGETDKSSRKIMKLKRSQQRKK